MGHENRVSVIIPCYNAAGYIAKCVEALARQTFGDFLAIFVDDCSTDSTVDAIEEAAESAGLNYLVIKNDHNCGPGQSRANGLAVATTKWVCFCDSDDWYDDGFIERMLGNVEDTGANVGICGYRVVGERGVVDCAPAAESRLLTASEALRLDVDSLCVLIVDRNSFRGIEMPDIRNGEDMCVVPALLSRAEGCYVDSACLYNYLRRSDSASERPTLAAVDSLLESFRCLRESIADGFEEELEFIGVKNCVYAIFITLFTVGYYPKKAAEILDSFEKVYPNWRENELIGTLPGYKRLVIGLVGKRRFAVLRLIALARGLMKL